MAIREIFLITACAAALSACGDRDTTERADTAIEPPAEDSAMQSAQEDPDAPAQSSEASADQADTALADAAPAPQARPADGAMNAPTLQGSYSEGDLSAEWDAWFVDGQLVRVVERQDLGEYGGSEVLIQYGADGQPVKFTETGERVIVGEGSGEPETLPFAKELYFENGEYKRGHSNQDGREGQPEDREVFAATQLALDARERALEKHNPAE